MATPFVFLYGPPASGKLTVATELAASTGLKLFHNHVSLDCAGTIFDWWSPPFNEALEAIRLQMIESAMRHGIGVIFTFMYAKPTDDAFVDVLAQRVSDAGGRLMPVQLRCAIATLERRVLAPSRQHTTKARTVQMLRSIINQHVCDMPLPGEQSLIINTDALQPAAAAGRIARHFALQET
jgi:hypothetical protein